MKTEWMRLEAIANGAPRGAVQAALDALDCQIAVLSSTGDVIAVNDAWRQMAESDVECATHVSPGQNYVQASVEHGTMSSEAREAVALVHAVLRRHTNQISLEYPCHRCGEKRWFQMNATACDIGGAPHVVLVHRSITGSKLLDDRRRTEDELRASLARKEEFLAILTHELRNPLAPIANALELLGRCPHDPKSVEHARGIIQRQLCQIKRLVDDLFDVSCIRQDRVHLQPTRVDIADVVAIAAETAQPLVDVRRHVLLLRVAPNLHYVQADPARLAQVLANLLINAAKYTDPEGCISVVAETRGTDVLIRVRDNGVGIEAGHLEQVFELYAQPATGARAGRGGLGIGLAVARELMRLQGGSITVHSEGRGRGSEFTLSLPRADDMAGFAG
jgi:signal transduction histidine kinase